MNNIRLFSLSFRSRVAVLHFLSKISVLYNQLDASPRWGELKATWSEQKLGPPVTTGDVSNNINLFILYINHVNIISYLGFDFRSKVPVVVI